MKDISGMTLPEMKTYFEKVGEKPYRATQVFRWIYRGVKNFDEMTDLSKELRDDLKEKALISTPFIEEVKTSSSDETKKYLLSMKDGSLVESVLMKYDYGLSVCISSQAGCAMGCSFCASAKGGKKRNLETGEMTGQILAIANDTGNKAGHVVVMGTGEPFDNYENTSKFIKIINDKNGLNIGMRNITVSTCGIIPGIERFADEFPNVNLAVSLHSVSDKTRTSLMPINRKYPLKELLKACKKYTDKTGRRITYEYALISGVNDGPRHIEALAEALKGMLCHVNLIPLNEVCENPMTGPGRKRASKIAAELEKKGIPATVRRELGVDIDAACGQLRSRKSREQRERSEQ
ncbi:MAG TPA: 23S rRNA (adenine(2503)-C(2))-methyltransferase RlmN [Bacillota bacterium]|nr:23S rRNA (adenine(2503)-C(2))-methyltransferase RlmN [Bacillota bacterium]HUM56106.1 23S rRNA (adenine(2503)-C(2))-methyltransferase RlmN [Bacillota bacterium]